MKIKKTKRGFTIVELVIVIAVIGVLTAILVPTFINLTAKANKASDNSLVANLNTALKMQEGEATDKKNETMHDAVEDLDNYGYNLTNLVAKSSDDLLYSLEENRFYLSDAEQVKADLEAGKGYKYWHIQDNLTNPKGYSIYAGRNFGETTVSVTAGFDAGDKTIITSVTYDRHDATVGQDVVIRTNGEGCALTVNAPKDTVHHFDNLGNLTVSAIAGASYHEHGTIKGNAVIASGHFVVEQKATVNTVIVDNTNKAEGATEAPTVKASNGSAVGTVVVNTVTTGTKVEVEQGAKVEEVAAGNEAAKTAMTQEGQQIAQGKDVAEEILDTSEASKFAGGLGLEKNPYLVASEEQVLNMYGVIVNNYQTKRTFFKVIDDITMELSYSTSPRSAIPYLYNAELDLGGKSITLPNLVALIYSASNAVVKNGTVKNLNQTSIVDTCYDAQFTSVRAEANTNASADDFRNVGAFVTYAYGNITFDACTVAGSFITKDTTTNYNALFVGYAFYNTGKTLVFNNCVNEATMSGGRAAIFVGNIGGSDGGKAALVIKVNDFRNEGSVRYTFADVSTSPYIAISNAEGRYTLLVNGVETVARTTSFPGFFVSSKDSTLGLTLEDGKLSVVEASATDIATYKISYGVYVTMLDEEGKNVGSDYVAVSFEMSASSLSSVKVLRFVDKAFLDANNVDATGLHAGDKVKVGGEEFYFVGATNLHGNILSTRGVAVSARVFSVAAYDTNGALIATASL